MEDTYPTMKAAAVQASSVFMDREATVDKACRLIHEAGSNGADLIVFPELWVPGYCYWFRHYNGTHPVSIRLNRELFKNAVEIPSTATDRLCEAARAANAYVVMGLNERRPGKVPGTLYNTMLFIDRNGAIMGKHQKLIPTFTEKLLHAMGDGSTLRVFQADFGPIGGLACGENGNPLFRFALYAQGEVVHTAGWPDTFSSLLWHDQMLLRLRNYAYEGKLYVVSAADVFTEEMMNAMELDIDSREDSGPDASVGQASCIIGPTGEYLAGPAGKGEAIIYADLNIEDLIDARYQQDFTGHYNRFDVVSLNYNGAPNLPIHFAKSEEAETQDTLRAEP